MPKPNPNVPQDPVLRMQEDQRIINMIAEVKKLMTEGINQISSKDMVKTPVMVLGRTGSGKSTLINLLAGKPLISRYNEQTKKFFLDSPDMLPGITIGNDQPAETSIPYPWIYNEDTVFWDCPGFDDNRGLEQEITSAFLIKNLFKAYQTCKILIVISDADLNDIRALNLLSIVRALDFFFRSDVEKIRPGLMLVVSGVNQDKTTIKIQETLQALLGNSLIALTTPQKEILRIFINNPLIIFKRPIAEGAFDTTCTKQYLETIEHLGTINNLRVKLAISAATRLILLEMYTYLLGSVNLEIDNFMKELHLQLQSFISNKRSKNDLQELKTVAKAFEAISTKLDNGTVLPNEQLLEIVAECRELNISRNIGTGSPTLNVKQMQDKIETFYFLDRFIEREAKVELEVQKTIASYLSNCISDVSLSIKTIEENVEKEKIIAIQFELEKKKAETKATEDLIPEAEKKLEAAKTAVQNYTPPAPRQHGGIKHVGHKIFGW